MFQPVLRHTRSCNCRSKLCFSKKKKWRKLLEEREIDLGCDSFNIKSFFLWRVFRSFLLGFTFSPVEDKNI